MILRMSHFRAVPRTVTPLAAVLLLIAVAAAHAGVWYFIARHPGLSGTVASALIALAVIKHMGWLGGARALLRRRRADRK